MPIHNFPVQDCTPECCTCGASYNGETDMQGKQEQIVHKTAPKWPEIFSSILNYSHPPDSTVRNIKNIIWDKKYHI